MVRYNQPLTQVPYVPTMQNNMLSCAYVQGEAAAKAYPVAPGQFVVLIDTEDPVIYTKTTDQFGRPMPIRILDYVERVDPPVEQPKNSEYITKSDFDKFKNEIIDLLKTNQNKQNNFKKQDREEQK